MCDVKIRIQKAPERLQWVIIPVKLRGRLPKYPIHRWNALLGIWHLHFRGNSTALSCAGRIQVDGFPRHTLKCVLQEMNVVEDERT